MLETQIKQEREQNGGKGKAVVTELVLRNESNTEEWQRGTNRRNTEDEIGGGNALTINE